MKYYLGVDGGGTKTECVWVNEEGMVVLRAVNGSSNPNDIGKDRMIADMVRYVKESMPLDADMVCISMGLSGLGFAGCKEELKTALEGIEKVRFIDVCSDVQIALDSVYDKDGCIVIMGTGSVGYLRKNGVHTLVGGCGYIIDSSLSGYDLGREALNAVCSELDGRGEKTVLTKLILEKTKKSVGELVKETYLYGKSFVASFAPFVFEGYDCGDRVAKDILARRVKEWESLLLGVHKRYGEAVCEIALIGGLTKRWDTISSFLSQEVREKISFKIPEKPVVYGALRRAGLSTEDAFLATYRS